MGAQQSKVRISIPTLIRCFPAYDNEYELFETVKKIEDCHVQAVQLASWIGSMIKGPCTPFGHIAFTAATLLFTFLLHRLTSNKSDKTGKCDQGDKCNNNSDLDTCDQKESIRQGNLEDALIDAKVSTAIAKKSVCELQAKLCIVNNRYQRLLSEISSEDRRLEVVPALQTCEEILQLFHDSTHVFRLNPLVTSPFLVTFAGIFVAVAELSLVLIPSYKGPLVGEMNLLSETLSMYKTACIQVRIQNLIFRSAQPGSMLEVVAGGMSEILYKMEDKCLQGIADQTGGQETLDEEEIDRYYQSTNQAAQAYRNELESEYDKFFATALEVISRFSGFGSN